MANDERLFSETEQKAADASQDAGETAERLTGAAEGDGEQTIGRLPGTVSSLVGDGESDAPADETSEHEHAKLDRSDARDGEKPEQPTGGFDRSVLLARIQHSTAQGGLQAEVGEDDDLTPGSEPYNRFFENKDWRCCAEAANPLENPFLPLYLDFAQHEGITPEMVQDNYDLLFGFWRGLLSASKSEVLESLGGRNRIANEYVSQLRWARKHFENENEEVTTEKIEEQYQYVRQRRDDQLVPIADAYLRDGVLDPAETASLFEENNDRAKVPLEETEIANLLRRKLNERSFVSYGEPEGDTLVERLRSVQWLSPKKHKEKRKEARKQAETASARALKIGDGEARTVSELVDLCDQNWDEAQDALFHGNLEMWISGQLGEMNLTREVRQIRERHNDERKKGLEKVVRLFCTAGTPEQDPTPKLSLVSEAVNFEDCPVGVRHTARIQFTLNGARRAWGTVGQHGDLPGLHVPDGFDVTDSEVKLRLDTLDVKPGTYEGKIVVVPEGGSKVSVSVRYRVVPLEVDLAPPKLALGAVAYGKEVSSTLQVTSSPSEGRLVGTASLNPPIKGTKLSGELSGNASTLNLTVNAAELQAGSKHETNVHMNTNVGVIDVPVSFRITLDWLTVGGWTAGLAALCGAVLATTRHLLTQAQPAELSTWVLSFPASNNTLGTAAIFGTVLTLAIAAAIWWYRKNRKASADTKANSYTPKSF